MACSTKAEGPRGHWHESFGGQTIHCYHISDTLVSLDKFTFGYSREVENVDIFQSMVPNSGFDLLADKDVRENQFTILDTITWTQIPNNLETFLTDLSLGLLVKVEPPELLNSEFELPYDTFATRIFIGQLKNGQTDGEEFSIQLNEVKATANDLFRFLVSETDNSNKIVILHSDKNTPDQLMTDVINEILKTGYSRENIYRTAIKKKNMTMGLVRCM